MRTQTALAIQRKLGTQIALFLLMITTSFLSLAEPKNCKGAYTTGYKNLFSQYGFDTQANVDKKIDAIYQQFKFGDATTEKLFYDAPDGTAYVLAADSQDVRTEGVSYGMMIALQMNDQVLFDKLWKFAVTHMLQKDKAGNPHHFAWQLKASDLSVMDPNPAPDGEEYMAMSLVFAKYRWVSTGDEKDTKNYAAWATAMTNLLKNNLFNAKQKMILFSPNTAKPYTDPSYHLPAFYRFFAEWSATNSKDKKFWNQAADKSIQYFSAVTDSTTGLPSEYSWFDGKPVATADSGTGNKYSTVFAYDSWRVIQNMAMDYYWCSQDSTLQKNIQRQLTFFKDQGGANKMQYGGIYNKDGTVINPFKNSGLIAMNAVAALAVDESLGKPFVQELWNQATPTGKYRYYDGLLHLFGYLHVSGRYKIYGPDYQTRQKAATDNKSK